VTFEEKPTENKECASADDTPSERVERNLRFETASSALAEAAVPSVEKEFECLSIRDLKKAAKDKGASEEDLEKCEDAIDFKRALIDLILSKDRVVVSNETSIGDVSDAAKVDSTWKAQQLDVAVNKDSGKEALEKSDSAVYLAALSRLNDQLGKHTSIRKISEHTRVPPLGVASIAALLVLSYTIYGLFGQLVSTFFGVVVPAYYSFKSIEEFSELCSDDSELYAKAKSMRFWVIYWVVLAVFMTVEYFAYSVLFWLPLYQPTKLAVLLWLYLPQTRGASFVYHWCVAPLLRRHKHRIDGALEHSANQIKTGVKDTLGGAVDKSFGGVRVLKESITDIGFAAIKKFA
jgi:hypothetical protein